MKNKSHTKCESNGGERNINSSLRVLNCCKEVMSLRQACMEAGSKLNHLTDVSLSNFVRILDRLQPQNIFNSPKQLKLFSRSFNSIAN